MTRLLIGLHRALRRILRPGDTPWERRDLISLGSTLGPARRSAAADPAETLRGD